MVRRFIEPVTVHAFYNLIACTRTVYLLRASTVKWPLVFDLWQTVADIS
jgi:hypothetical protein